MTEEGAPPAEAPAPAEGEENPEGEEEEKEEKPCMDISELFVKTEHFDQMHMLGPDGKVEGAANFRKVNGFPVYGTAQPTEEGFMNVLTKIAADAPDKAEEKISWYIMRQDPVCYINGTPYSPRKPDDLHMPLEIQEFIDDIPALDNLGKHFARLVQQRADADPNHSVKVHRDGAFNDNPMERTDVEESLKVEGEVKYQHMLFENCRQNGFPLLETQRIPVRQERAPAERCFDILVDSLKNQPASQNCVFSCQLGRMGTSLGMVIACLVKEIQITTELRKMGSPEIGLVPQDTVDDLIKTKFEAPLPVCPDDDDPFIKGEFDVIKELIEKHPEMAEGKRKVDYVININGPPPKGTGLQNLRECVIETKWKYDVASEDKQVVWKQMILAYLERYFYLICFATYALEVGSGGFDRSFVSWMDERSHLRKMIDEGKDKLEWYRQVDPAKLNTLKEIINSPDYKENMGKLIKTIYEFAFMTYADLPRGPIKNNSMRKLAATTLLEILPPDIAANVNKKLEEGTGGHDFLTVVGLVSYYGSDGD